MENCRAHCYAQLLGGLVWLGATYLYNGHCPSGHEAIVAADEAVFARRKPGKEALAYHAIDVQQRNVVKAALFRRD